MSQESDYGVSRYVVFLNILYILEIIILTECYMFPLCSFSHTTLCNILYENQ